MSDKPKAETVAIIPTGNLTFETVARLTEAMRGNSSLVLEDIPRQIPEDFPDSVLDAVAEALGDAAYDCTHKWSAWGGKTMDLVSVAGQPDRVAEIAMAAITAWELEKAKQFRAAAARQNQHDPDLFVQCYRQQQGTLPGNPVIGEGQ